MSRITIVRSGGLLPPETILGYVRNFLFGLFDGYTDEDKAGWRKLWKKFLALEPGECMVFEFMFIRSGPYQRRHMKIENDIFKAQDRFIHFEQFRYWLKVGSAWVDWFAGPGGGVIPIPRSTSYAAADQAEFEQYHKQVIEFLHGPRAAPYLWKHLGDKSHEMMDSILNEFNE